MESNRPSGGLLRPAGFEDRRGIRLVQGECVALNGQPLGAFSVARGFESLPLRFCEEALHVGRFVGPPADPSCRLRRGSLGGAAFAGGSDDRAPRCASDHGIHQTASWTTTHTFDVYLSNAVTPSGDSQLVSYNFRPASRTRRRCDMSRSRRQAERVLDFVAHARAVVRGQDARSRAAPGRRPYAGSSRDRGPTRGVGNLLGGARLSRHGGHQGERWGTW
jgi:hypothetical protein